MPLDAAGAVVLLEIRPARRAADPAPAALEPVFAQARLLLEAPGPGSVWSRAGGAGVSGSLSFGDAGEAFRFLHRLRTEVRSDPARPAVQVVAGLGRGDDVEAARFASDAFRSLGRKGRILTRALTPNPDSNTVLGALCRTMDSLVVGWTDAQWQAIHRRDRGRTLQEIGEELGIAYQNVSKRLIAAQYALYREVLEAAGLVFQRAAPRA
jgi:hypothetical protein